MQRTLGLILFGLGLWRAAIDWRATIGAGYAYRFATFETLLTAAAPARTAAAWLETHAPALWDPVATTLLALPAAPTLLALAALLVLTRRGRRR